MKILKCKHKGGHTVIKYAAEEGETVYTLESFDAPLPILNECLQSLAEDVAAICELNPRAALGITVLGLTVTDSEDSERATISATVKLTSGATMCLNTPCLPYTAQNGPQISGATANRIEAVRMAAQGFVLGERAQGELPLEEIQAAEAPKAGEVISFKDRVGKEFDELAARTGGKLQRDVTVSV